MRVAVKHYKTIFTNGDFLIGLYLLLDKQGEKFVTCKGYGLPQNKNTFYFFEVEEEVDSKGKVTYNVSSFTMAEPKTKHTIAMFLSGDEFLGIGKDIINAIVNKYEKDVFDIIENNPQELLNVPGMTEEKLTILVNGYNSASSLKKLSKFLSPMGITNRQIRLINEAGITLERIKSDPFYLVNIKGIGFKTCDTIARYMKTALNSPERVKGGVLETFNEISTSGDTYALDVDLIAKAKDKLNDGLQEEIVSRKNVIDAIADLIRSDEVYVSNNHKLSLSKYYRAEVNTAKTLLSLLKHPLDDSSELIQAASSYRAFPLSDSQLSAVNRALSNRVSIITGGAGTGKTTIMNAIIRAYKKVCPQEEITLLAPTGKASRRIFQSTGIESYTIHARLGINEASKTPDEYIPGGLVMVDEFSMVDTLLFEKLAMALDSNCHLVLLGDINQLPSVSAGACLKDMIDSGVIPTSYLTDIFRQNDGSIIDNSLKIVNKATDLIYDSNMMFVKVRNEQESIEQIKKIYKYYTEKDGIESIALITPLRSNQEGRFRCVADELNNIIQCETNMSDVSYKFKGIEFKLNDRVMCWKNTSLVQNGDVGVITNIDLDNNEWQMEMTIEWENGNKTYYHKPDLENLTLAYAMTVHKSQGSEYQTVVVPILKQQKCRLFKNNLLYTAITRAKKRVIILCDDESVMDYMIHHSETNERHTLFKECLEKVYKEG